MAKKFDTDDDFEFKVSSKINKHRKNLNPAVKKKSDKKFLYDDDFQDEFFEKRRKN